MPTCWACQNRCIAVIVRREDDDDKLVVVPEGVMLDDVAIIAATRFQEQWFEGDLMRRAHV